MYVKVTAFKSFVGCLALFAGGRRHRSVFFSPGSRLLVCFHFCLVCLRCIYICADGIDVVWCRACVGKGGRQEGERDGTGGLGEYFCDTSTFVTRERRHQNQTRNAQSRPATAAEKKRRGVRTRLTPTAWNSDTRPKRAGSCSMLILQVFAPPLPPLPAFSSHVHHATPWQSLTRHPILTMKSNDKYV